MTIPTGPEAPVKKSKLKPLLIAAAVVAAIGVGYAAGSSAAPDKTAKVSAADLALPTRVTMTVTETGSAPTTRTVTDTKTVESTVKQTVVPAECLSALRDTDQLIDVTIDVLGITADMFGAVSEFDTVTLDRLTAKLDAKKIPMTSAVTSFKDHRDACLAAA